MEIKNKGLWLLPVMVFALPIIHRIYFLVTALKFQRQNQSNPFYRFYFEVNLKDRLSNIFTIIFLIEIIAYFLLRKRLFKWTWVVIHAVLSFFAFIVFPTLHKTGILLLSIRGIEVKWIDVILLFFLPIALGHFFFILTIVKSFRKRKFIHESPGLLDEFVS